MADDGDRMLCGARHFGGRVQWSRSIGRRH